ncbi:thioesterase family protein [Saccharothrix sp. ST-888]|uniref:thioesterase family protein n=1 Tax=Saccharothrix sp. ST-888 TaxID=1427391 RepID=UPI0005ECB3C5|nr:thioesterase family protein [Saccharothrix sp. ST-888]KJK56100.1 TesB-like acyl-CoA thioesterase 5 [Saccharothrix sp. ST-888]
MTPDSAELPESFYRSLGHGCFESTAATAGPWSPKTQHAGPPSALIGRALERHEARAGFRVARVSLEIPRPVPVGDLRVEVRTIRSGGRTELLEGELTSGGQSVMLARAWRIAASPQDTPALRPDPGPPPLPGPQQPHGFTGAHLGGYVSAMEWRFAPGSGFDTPGPGAAWARQRIPLVAGEEDTPLTRALTLADSNWAVAFELDHVRRLVINTDVTLALHRDPVGEWLCLSAATAASPDGSGLAFGRLDDTAGDCGRILQTLLIAER